MQSLATPLPHVVVCIIDVGARTLTPHCELLRVVGVRLELGKLELSVMVEIATKDDLEIGKHQTHLTISHTDEW